MTLHRSTSPYNDRHTTIGRNAIIVSDCTLREGEQSPIVNFTADQKVAIAQRLAEAGIPQIQVGYPGLSESDRGIIRRLRDADIDSELEAVVLSYLASWREQIEAAAASGADNVHIVHVPSPPRREHVFGVSEQEIHDRTDAAVSAAKELGLFVTYCPADTTRTELDLVLGLVATAERAGADRICVADTLGVATPGAVRHVVERVRAATPLPLAFHGHNDLGLAVANALAAIETGVVVVDATLNGWGDRSGNPATEELAAMLQLLYGCAPDLDLPALATLAKEAAQMVGVATPATKPITGDAAFAQKLETHVAAVLKHPPAFEGFDPQLVGGRRHIAIGQYSGVEAVRARLGSLGIERDAETLERVTRSVQSLARSTNRILSDDDLRSIVASAGER